jgi:pimeloyl-ACP methyl ester carboxylesterase
VLAPDLYGAGGSPQWPSDRIITLAYEVALLEPVLSAPEHPAALVGHSYGACVCLLAALIRPSRVRALALYEPNLSSLLDGETERPNEADGIRDVVVAAASAFDDGQPERAAERFIDYWMGPGSWRSMPEPHKPPVAAAMKAVRRWGHALFAERTPLEAFRSLDLPVLYMLGKRSTASALGVARLLAAVLPRVHVIEFDDLGHMGPVTHSHLVNEAVERFLTATLP